MEGQPTLAVCGNTLLPTVDILGSCGTHCSPVAHSLPNLSHSSPPAGNGSVAVNLELLTVNRMVASKPGCDGGIAVKIFLPDAKAGIVKVWQALCVTT
jgi:hypothetical protein